MAIYRKVERKAVELTLAFIDLGRSNQGRGIVGQELYHKEHKQPLSCYRKAVGKSFSFEGT